MWHIGREIVKTNEVSIRQSNLFYFNVFKGKLSKSKYSRK